MMQFKLSILSAGILLLCTTSCKKEYNAPTSLANINIVHAITNVPTIVVNTSGKKGVWSLLSASLTGKANYGTSLANALTGGVPSMLNIVSMSDTLTSLYQPKDFTPQPGELYTLYLAGSATAVEPILQKEQLVVRADSATAIRFINLVSNSTPISVNIRSTVTPEVTSLAYKQLSDFKVYDARKANASYVFEIRNASTQALLVTYTYAVARSFNVTLALRGLVGGTGTNALAVTRVNHY